MSDDAKTGQGTGSEGNYNLRILNTTSASPLPSPGGMASQAAPGSTAMNQAQMAFASQTASEPVVMFNQEQGPKETTTDTNKRIKIGAGIALVLCLPFLYIAFTGPGDPMENLLAAFDKINAFVFGAKEDAVVSVSKQDKPPPSPKALGMGDDLSGEFTPDMVANPYWYLPIAVPDTEKDKIDIGMMTAVEEDRWVEGLNSQFVYQGFKAASEMWNRKAPNSEMLLRKALQHKKFWTRFTAMQGLASMGQKITDEEAEKVFADTRSDLVLHYLQRFKGDHSPRTHYMMQHAIKFVDGQNRRAILKMLADDGEHRNRLYFAAATFDPGEEVQTWVKDYIAYHPVTPEVLRQFKDQTVRGYKGLETEPDKAPNAALAGTTAATVGDESGDDDVEPSTTEDLTVKRVEVYKDLPTIDLTNTPSADQNAGKKSSKNAPKALDKADDGFETLGGKAVKYKSIQGVILDSNGKVRGGQFRRPQYR